MVITTNILDREALCEQITERTVSRLTQMCDQLPLGGDDQRSVQRALPEAFELTRASAPDAARPNAR
jgi:hypothetical protein